MMMNQRTDVIGSVKARPWGSLLFDRNRWETLRLALGITPRELDVVKGVFDDRSRAEIGKTLGISEHTVQTHLERIYRKTGVGSRCGLIVGFFAKHMELPVEEPADSVIRCVN